MRAAAPVRSDQLGSLNHVARECPASRRIRYRDQATIDIETLREVAGSLELRRHGARDQIGCRRDRPELLRPEEEQLVALPVEPAWNEHRTADIVVPRVVTRAWFRDPLLIVEKRCGVELLMTLPVRHKAVQVPRT